MKSFPLPERQPCSKHLGMEYVKAVYLSAYTRMYFTIVARKTRGNRWGNAELFVLYYSVDFSKGTSSQRFSTNKKRI